MTALVSVCCALLAVTAEEWELLGDTWRVADGEIEQQSSSGGHMAFLRHQVLSDVDLECEFRASSAGDGVHAATLFWRSTGSLTRYHAHFDCANRQVILVRTTPRNPWIEIARRGGLDLAEDEWHAARIVHRGSACTIHLDGDEVLRADDAALSSGLVGVGTSQGRVAFRSLAVSGTPGELEEGWTVEQPVRTWHYVCEDAGAGGYEAFPDVRRLQNGDLLCVFYAGYGHVSLPNADMPRGGRVCSVRSSDNGRTWGDLTVVYDGPHDDRDPHIAQLRDGALICTFFSLSVEADGGYSFEGSMMVRSADNGESWS